MGGTRGLFLNYKCLLFAIGQNFCLDIEKICLLFDIPKRDMSTSSLISSSFQGDPTIFQRGIFLKQTPHIKN